MKPAPFEYHAPETVEEAVALLDAHGDDAKVLAGGQSLVPMMNMRLARPAVIVDINRVHALNYLAEDGATLALGALCRQRTAERSALVARRCPLLVDALAVVGHAQIRNRGTVVGSLAHADPAAELCAVLAILDGTVTAVGPQGARSIRADALFVSYLTTSLDPRESLTEARFPSLPRGAGWAWKEIARRHGDFALAGVGVVLALRGGAIAEARIALTGVGPTPIRAARTERALAGAAPSDTLWESAAGSVREEIEPDGDIHASAEYRRHVAGILTRRALADAAARVEEAASTPREITLRINGAAYVGRAEPRKTLADFIREDCGLTGTHLGCEHGVCGACTILLDGEAVRSCLLFAVQAEGAALMTVEGLAHGDRLHPIQQAYAEHHALQCGFCTPGFLMTTVALLRDTPRPTEREIREGLSGNLCRCTGYQNIVRAVAAAAEVLAPAGAGSPPAPAEAAAPKPRTAARSAGRGGRSDPPEGRRPRG